MKTIFYVAIWMLIISGASAQQTGKFELTIQYDDEDRLLAAYVPEDYSSEKKYPLVVGLHGCGQPYTDFRDDLQTLGSDMDMIIVVIEALGSSANLGKMMDTEERALVIPAAIENIVTQYSNINTEEIYLTGFSCNGATTLLHGLNKIYPFKGIIPFNPFLPNSFDDLYDFESDVKTCICSGTADGNFSKAQSIFNSFRSKGGNVLFNSMQGVPHTTRHPTFTAEMTECIEFINSTVTSVDNDELIEKYNLSVSPNIVNSNSTVVSFNVLAPSQIELYLYDSKGQKLQTLNNSTLTIGRHDFSIDTDNMPSGKYFISLKIGNHNLSSKFVVVR